MRELARWDSFYVIVGSAAGALIGLQFVVLTLIAERPRIIHSREAGAAFATPTIIHFGAALLLSALSRMPWQTLTAFAVIWGIVGFTGVAYAITVARQMRAQGAYRPEFIDWICYFVLPLAAYATLAGSAFAAWSHPREGLFGLAGAALLLLFVGIHNSWDSVSYHVFTYRPNEASEQNNEATVERAAVTQVTGASRSRERADG